MDDNEMKRLRALLDSGELPWVLSGVRVKWRMSYGDHVMDSHAIGPDDTKGAVCLVPYDERHHARDYGYARLIHAAVNSVGPLMDEVERLTAQNEDLLAMNYNLARDADLS